MFEKFQIITWRKAHTVHFVSTLQSSDWLSLTRDLFFSSCEMPWHHNGGKTYKINIKKNTQPCCQNGLSRPALQHLWTHYFMSWKIQPLPSRVNYWSTLAGSFNRWFWSLAVCAAPTQAWSSPAYTVKVVTQAARTKPNTFTSIHAHDTMLLWSLDRNAALYLMTLQCHENGLFL